MKLLIVGDPHVSVKEMEDCKNLHRFVLQKAFEANIVVFMGDLFNDFSLVHNDLKKFWYNVFCDFKEARIPTVSLVGNHDLSSTGTGTDSLVGFESITRVVRSVDVMEGMVFAPYYIDNNKLVNDVTELGSNYKYLFCHSEFNGARYDNNFPITKGIDLEKLNNIEYVISGHIHLPSKVRNLEYVGSPRWLTQSDANQDKHLMLLDTETNERTYFNTDSVCSKRFLLTDKEEAPLEGVDFNAQHRYTIDIHGSERYIKSRIPLWSKFAQIRTVPVFNKKKSQIKESEGINVAFNKYTELYNPPNGTNKDELKRLIQERL